MRGLPEEEDLSVSEVMTKNVIVIDSKESVQKAATLMRKSDIRGVVVKSGKKIVGMVTDRDIVSKVVAENKPPRDVKVEDIMSPKLITASPEDTITDVAKRMYANRVGRIPIVDKEGNLVGIVTETDMTKLAPALIELLYEHDAIEEPEAVVHGRKLIEGRCEECGQVYEDLVEIDGEWLCQNCSRDRTRAGSVRT